ncbi:MAG: hypothetical protein KAU21_06145 [Gammaproteobacteria bacterium]|nr:hypothetical protein [Gammaproteobacteria bacterium]
MLKYLPKSMNKKMSVVVATVVSLGFPMTSWSNGSKGESATEEAVEQAIAMHEQAVEKLIMAKDIQVPYSYIAQLMRLPNAFGEGAACVLCHSSNNSKESYRGLDLTSCEGIKKGSTEAPAQKVIIPGKPKKGLLRRHIRNNRMPLGVAFDYPQDSPNIVAVKKWIDDGALNDNHFNREILPLFKQSNAFGSPIPCTACHMSNQEPPSFHELDMTSYKGIMLGADALAKAAEGKPPVKIVKPGKSAKSKLYQRLVDNRMPAGISPSEDRDHANLALLLRWIEQGAKCN